MPIHFDRQNSKLEEYFTSCFEKGQIDHVVRSHVHEDGQVSFYIHPDAQNGDTADFIVKGNELFSVFSDDRIGIDLASGSDKNSVIGIDFAVLGKEEEDDLKFIED